MPKQQLNLAICIPTAGLVRMEFAYSLAGLVATLTTTGVPSRPECRTDCKILTFCSSAVYVNREVLVMQALEWGATHVLFIDDDMGFAADAVSLMLGRRHPLVTTTYPLRDGSYMPTAVDLDNQRLGTQAHMSGLQPIKFTGFGLSVIETEVFKTVPQPWFLPIYLPDTRTYSTEDAPFFERCREHGFDCLLDHDASKLVTHYGSRGWSWTDMYQQG